MSSTYTIRRAATDADYGAIRKIHVDLFVGGYKEVPCLDRGTWWVVTVGKDVVGFAGLYRSSIRRGTAYLCRCGVLTAHQGHGLQKRLIRVRLQWLRRNKFRSVVTDTAGDNPASANSLLACGFRMYVPAGRWESYPIKPGSVFWQRRV